MNTPPHITTSLRGWLDNASRERPRWLCDATTRVCLGDLETGTSLGGRAVRTSSGLRITPDEDLREVRLPRPGLLIVPGGQGSRRPDPELTGWLRAPGRPADRLVSWCTGAFLLGRRPAELVG